MKLKPLKIWQGILLAIGAILLAVGGAFLYVYFTSGIGPKTVYPEEITFVVDEDEEGYNAVSGQYEKAEDFFMTISTETEEVSEKILTLSFTINFTDIEISDREGYITDGVITIPHQIEVGKPFKIEVNKIDVEIDGEIVSVNKGGISTIYAKTTNKTMKPISTKVAIDVPVEKISTNVVDMSGQAIEFDEETGRYNITEGTDFKISTIYTPENSQYIYGDETIKKQLYYEVLEGSENFTMHKDGEIYFSASTNLKKTAKIKVYSFKNAVDQIAFNQSHLLDTEAQVYNSALMYLSNNRDKSVVSEINLVIVQANVKYFSISRKDDLTFTSNKLYRITAGDSQSSDLNLGVNIFDSTSDGRLGKNLTAMIRYIAVRPLKRLGDQYVETNDIKIVGGESVNLVDGDTRNYTFINSNVRDLKNSYFEVSSTVTGDYYLEFVLMRNDISTTDEKYYVFEEDGVEKTEVIALSFIEGVEAGIGWKDSSNIEMVIYSGQDIGTEYSKNLTELISVPQNNHYQTVVFFASFNDLDEDEVEIYINYKSTGEYTIQEQIYKLYELTSTNLVVKAGVNFEIRFAVVVTDAYGEILKNNNGTYKISQMSTPVYVSAIETVSGLSSETVSIEIDNEYKYTERVGDDEISYYVVPTESGEFDLVVNLDEADANLMGMQIERFSIYAFDVDREESLTDVLNVSAPERDGNKFTYKLSFKPRILENKVHANVKISLVYTTPIFTTTVTVGIKEGVSEGKDYLTVYKKAPVKFDYSEFNEEFTNVEKLTQYKYKISQSISGGVYGSIGLQLYKENEAIGATIGLPTFNEQLAKIKVLDEYGKDITTTYPISLTSDNTNLVTIVDNQVNIASGVTDGNCRVYLKSGNYGDQIVFIAGAASVQSLTIISDDLSDLTGPVVKTIEPPIEKTTELSSFDVEKLGYKGGVIYLEELVVIYVGEEGAEPEALTSGVEFRLSSIMTMSDDNKKYLFGTPSYGLGVSSYTTPMFRVYGYVDSDHKDDEVRLFGYKQSGDSDNNAITFQSVITRLEIDYDFGQDLILPFNIVGVNSGISIAMNLVVKSNIGSTQKDFSNIYANNVVVPENDSSYVGIYAQYPIDLNKTVKVNKMFAKAGNSKEIFWPAFEGEVQVNQTKIPYSVLISGEKSNIKIGDVFEAVNVEIPLYEVNNNPFAYNTILRFRVYPNLKLELKDSQALEFTKIADGSPENIGNYFVITRYVVEEGVTPAAVSAAISDLSLLYEINGDVPLTTGGAAATFIKNGKLLLPYGVLSKDFTVNLKKSNKIIRDYKNDEVSIDMDLTLGVTYDAIAAKNDWMSIVNFNGIQMALIEYTGGVFNLINGSGYDGYSFNVLANVGVISKISDTSFTALMNNKDNALKYGDRIYLPLSMRDLTGEEVAIISVPLLISSIGKDFAYYEAYNPDVDGFDLYTLLSDDYNNLPENNYAISFIAGENKQIVYPISYEEKLSKKENLNVVSFDGTSLVLSYTKDGIVYIGTTTIDNVFVQLKGLSVPLGYSVEGFSFNVDFINGQQVVISNYAEGKYNTEYRYNATKAITKEALGSGENEISAGSLVNITLNEDVYTVEFNGKVVENVSADKLNVLVEAVTNESIGDGDDQIAANSIVYITSYTQSGGISFTVTNGEKTVENVPAGKLNICFKAVTKENLGEEGVNQIYGNTPVDVISSGSVYTIRSGNTLVTGVPASKLNLSLKMYLNEISEDNLTIPVVGEEISLLTNINMVAFKSANVTTTEGIYYDAEKAVAEVTIVKNVLEDGVYLAEYYENGKNGYLNLNHLNAKVYTAVVDKDKVDEFGKLTEQTTLYAQNSVFGEIVLDQGVEVTIISTTTDSYTISYTEPQYIILKVTLTRIGNPLVYYYKVKVVPTRCIDVTYPNNGNIEYVSITAQDNSEKNIDLSDSRFVIKDAENNVISTDSDNFVKSIKIGDKEYKVGGTNNISYTENNGVKTYTVTSYITVTIEGEAMNISLADLDTAMELTITKTYKDVVFGKIDYKFGINTSGYIYSMSYKDGEITNNTWEAKPDKQDELSVKTKRTSKSDFNNTGDVPTSEVVTTFTYKYNFEGIEDYSSKLTTEPVTINKPVQGSEAIAEGSRVKLSDNKNIELTYVDTIDVNSQNLQVTKSVSAEEQSVNIYIKIGERDCYATVNKESLDGLTSESTLTEGAIVHLEGFIENATVVETVEVEGNTEMTVTKAVAVSDTEVYVAFVHNEKECTAKVNKSDLIGYYNFEGTSVLLKKDGVIFASITYNYIDRNIKTNVIAPVTEQHEVVLTFAVAVVDSDGNIKAGQTDVGVLKVIIPKTVIIVEADTQLYGGMTYDGSALVSSVKKFKETNYNGINTGISIGIDSAYSFMEPNVLDNTFTTAMLNEDKEKVKFVITINEGGNTYSYIIERTIHKNVTYTNDNDFTNELLNAPTISYSGVYYANEGNATITFDSYAKLIGETTNINEGASYTAKTLGTADADGYVKISGVDVKASADESSGDIIITTKDVAADTSIIVPVEVTYTFNEIYTYSYIVKVSMTVKKNTIATVNYPNPTKAEVMAYETVGTEDGSYTITNIANFFVNKNHEFAADKRVKFTSASGNSSYVVDETKVKVTVQNVSNISSVNINDSWTGNQNVTLTLTNGNVAGEVIFGVTYKAVTTYYTLYLVPGKEYVVEQNETIQVKNTVESIYPDSMDDGKILENDRIVKVVFKTGISSLDGKVMHVEYIKDSDPTDIHTFSFKYVDDDYSGTTKYFEAGVGLSDYDYSRTYYILNNEEIEITPFEVNPVTTERVVAYYRSKLGNIPIDKSYLTGKVSRIEVVSMEISADVVITVTKDVLSTDEKVEVTFEINGITYKAELNKTDLRIKDDVTALGYDAEINEGVELQVVNPETITAEIVVIVNQSFSGFNISSLDKTDVDYHVNYYVEIDGTTVKVGENLTYKFKLGLDIDVENKMEENSIIIINATDLSNITDLVTAAGIYHPATGEYVTAEDFIDTGITSKISIYNPSDNSQYDKYRNYIDNFINRGNNSSYADGMNKSFLAGNEIRYLSYEELRAGEEENAPAYNFKLVGEGASNEGSYAMIIYTYEKGALNKSFCIMVKILPDYNIFVNNRTITSISGDGSSVSTNETSAHEIVYDETNGYTVTLTREATPGLVRVVKKNSTYQNDLAPNWTYTIEVEEDTGSKYNIDLDKLAYNEKNVDEDLTGGWTKTVDDENLKNLTWKTGTELTISKEQENSFGTKYYKVKMENEYGYIAYIYFTFKPTNDKDPIISSSFDSIVEGESFDIGAIYDQLNLEEAGWRFNAVKTLSAGTTLNEPSVEDGYYIVNYTENGIEYSAKTTSDVITTSDPYKVKSGKTLLVKSEDYILSADAKKFAFGEVSYDVVNEDPVIVEDAMQVKFITESGKTTVQIASESEILSGTVVTFETEPLYSLSLSSTNNTPVSTTVDNIINIGGLNAWGFGDTTTINFNMNQIVNKDDHEIYLNPDKMTLNNISVESIKFYFNDLEVGSAKLTELELDPPLNNPQERLKLATRNDLNILEELLVSSDQALRVKEGVSSGSQKVKVEFTIGTKTYNATVEKTALKKDGIELRGESTLSAGNMVYLQEEETILYNIDANDLRDGLRDLISKHQKSNYEMPELESWIYSYNGNASINPGGPYPLQDSQQVTMVITLVYNNNGVNETYKVSKLIQVTKSEKVDRTQEAYVRDGEAFELKENNKANPNPKQDYYFTGDGAITGENTVFTTKKHVSAIDTTVEVLFYLNNKKYMAEINKVDLKYKNSGDALLANSELEEGDELQVIDPEKIINIRRYSTFLDDTLVVTLPAAVGSSYQRVNIDATVMTSLTESSNLKVNDIVYLQKNIKVGTDINLITTEAVGSTDTKVKLSFELNGITYLTEINKTDLKKNNIVLESTTTLLKDAVVNLKQSSYVEVKALLYEIKEVVVNEEEMTVIEDVGAADTIVNVSFKIDGTTYLAEINKTSLKQEDDLSGDAILSKNDVVKLIESDEITAKMIIEVSADTPLKVTGVNETKTNISFIKNGIEHNIIDLEKAALRMVGAKFKDVISIENSSSRIQTFYVFISDKLVSIDNPNKGYILKENDEITFNFSGYKDNLDTSLKSGGNTYKFYAKYGNDYIGGVFTPNIFTPITGTEKSTWKQTVKEITYDRINIEDSEMFGSSVAASVIKSYIIDGYRVEKEYFVTPYVSSSNMNYESRTNGIGTINPVDENKYDVTIDKWSENITLYTVYGKTKNSITTVPLTEKLDAINGKVRYAIGANSASGTSIIDENTGEITTRSGYELGGDEFIHVCVYVKASGFDGTFSNKDIIDDYMIGQVRVFVKSGS